MVATRRSSGSLPSLGGATRGGVEALDIAEGLEDADEQAARLAAATPTARSRATHAPPLPAGNVSQSCTKLLERSFNAVNHAAA